MNQAATLGSQGVIGHLDCRVQATSPATAGINITSGGVTILGQEATLQGSYTAWNSGTDSTLTIAATGGSPRSDMIIARAEDPTFSGSPWGGSPGAQIVFPRVISGVSSSATQAPGGQSAIPLARIDIPASTAAITNAMIHDLRAVANPQTTTGVLFAAGPGSGTDWTVSTTPHAWPPGASWQVQIPSSATQMVVMWQISNVFQDTTSWARGFVYPVFGTSVSSPVLAFPTTLVSYPAATTSPRVTISGTSQVSIGTSLRGTTQTLQFAQTTDGSQIGTLSAGEGTQTGIMYSFQQLAASA
jgi:hypothetical protein